MVNIFFWFFVIIFFGVLFGLFALFIQLKFISKVIDIIKEKLNV